MYSQHPDLAKEFEAHTPKGKKLPKHVKTASVVLHTLLTKLASNPFTDSLTGARNTLQSREALDNWSNYFIDRTLLHGSTGLPCTKSDNGLSGTIGYGD